METIATLGAIALVWGAAALVPGPDFLVIAQASAARSRRHGLMTVAGILTGTVVWGLAGFFGIGALFQLAPWLFVALKLLGGGYLVYLGLMLMREAARPDASAEAVPSTDAPGGLAAAWRRGLVTNLANPKTALFVASIFATMLPAAPSPALGLGAIAVATAVSGVWYALLATCLSAASVRRAYARAGRWIAGLSGGVLALFGARLAAER